MDRVGKEQYVVDLHETLKSQSIVVVTQQEGLTVAEMQALRADMRAVDAGFKVTKNSLAKIALRGTAHESLSDLMKGPVALAFSKDPIAAAKASVDYGKKNDKLRVMGAAMNGQWLDANAVKHLASLPSMDELRGTLVGLLVAPATRLATLSQAPAAQLARVFAAYGKKS